MPPPKPAEYEHSGIPTADEVTDAYADIIDHNKKHTGFGPIFKAWLNAHLSSGKNYVVTDDQEDPEVIDIKDVDLGSATAEQVLEGDMSATLQDILHSDLFTRIGIAIRPYGASVTTSEGNQATSKELVPLLDNSVLYNDFLETLTPEDIEVNVALKKLIESVNASVVNIVNNANSRTVAQLAAETPIDDALLAASEDALRTFTDLEPQYDRLGIDDSKLETYVKYWGQDVLSEYLKAESGQLLTPPEGQSFGPAHWHLDSGGYPGWEKAVQLLDLLESDNRTKGLSDEIRASLKVSVESALTELAQMEPEELYDYIKNATPNLQNVLKALEREPYDAKQLALFAPLSEHRTW